MHVLVHLSKRHDLFSSCHAQTYIPNPSSCTQISCLCRFLPGLLVFVITHFSFTTVFYHNKQNFTVLQERIACVKFLHSIIARKTSIKHGLRRKDYCFYDWPLCQLWSQSLVWSGSVVSAGSGVLGAVHTDHTFNFPSTPALLAGFPVMPGKSSSLLKRPF